MKTRCSGKRLLTMALLMALVAAVLLMAAAQAGAATKKATLVIINGKVLTVDKRFTVKQAVAVRGDKIVAVGTTKAIKKWIGPKTKVINLRGKTMLPGINDSHAHVSGFALGLPPFTLDLNDPVVTSIADVVAALQAKVATTSAGEWIRGQGWNAAYFSEGREPTKEDLDAVSPNNPVCLTDFSFHNVWCNSKALELAGITKDTPSPDGGVIVKDPVTGEPTGVLREAASGMVSSLVPGWTRAEQKAGMQASIAEFNANGITSITECSLPPTGTTMELYQELSKEKALNARMTLCPHMGYNFADFKKNLDAWTPPSGYAKKWLNYPGIKMNADGIPPTHTAWLWLGYVGGGFGSLVIDAPTDAEKYQNLVDMIVYGHSKGIQIQVHTTGDRAISAVIDGFEKAKRQNPRIKNTRDTIIHCELIWPTDIYRAAKLGMVAASQPYICKINADSAKTVIGDFLGRWDFPHRSILDGGMKLTFSSDASVTYPNWRSGVQQAILREGFTGAVNGPEQRVTRKEAIRAYTITGAWQDHMDKVKGSIEVGKLADFCILGQDIMTVDAHQLENIPVVQTIVGGKTVYTAP